MLDRTLAEAERAGIEVVLAVYPYPPREFELGGVDLTAFGRYLELLARRYPQVRQYVIGNEPNQPAFWRPLFRPAGPVASAAQAGALLAWAYDTLEAIDPSLRVVGVGLSPRGNDNPSRPATPRSRRCASSTRSAAGTARAGARPADGRLQLPSLPELGARLAGQGLRLAQRRLREPRPDQAGAVGRLPGTAQPTTLSGLQLYLDELGWQVDTSWSAAYTGRRTCASRARSRNPSTPRSCGVRRDPTIAAVNFFGLDDDRDIGWQAGLYRADGTPRGAAFGCQRDRGDRTVGMQRRRDHVAACATGRGRLGGSGAGGPRRSGGRQAFGRRGARAVTCVLTGAGAASPAALSRRMQGVEARSPGCRSLSLRPSQGLTVRLPAPRALPAGSSASASRRRRTRRGRRRAFCRSSIDSEHMFVHDTNTCSDGSS